MNNKDSFQLVHQRDVFQKCLILVVNNKKQQQKQMF